MSKAMHRRWREARLTLKYAPRVGFWVDGVCGYRATRGYYDHAFTAIREMIRYLRLKYPD